MPDNNSRQQTAKLAVDMLVSKDQRYQVPTAQSRLNILVAFAEANKVVYGKAFDVIRVDKEIDLNDLAAVRGSLQLITLCEVKSTSKKSVKKDFSGYFFAITAGEMLVAQSLGDQFRFVFVNTLSNQILELQLTEVFARARGIYPTWSVSF